MSSGKKRGTNNTPLKSSSTPPCGIAALLKRQRVKLQPFEGQRSEVLMLRGL